MGLFSGKKKTQKSTTTVEPPKFQKPYIIRGLERADLAYGNSAPNADVLNAYDLIGSRARNGSPLSSAVNDYATSVLRGDFLDQQNPYFQSVANDARQAVDSSYALAGRYGSGAHDTAVANAIGQLSYQDYDNRLNQRDRFAQLAPQLAANDYYDLDRLLQVGDQKRFDDFQRAAQYSDLVNQNFGQTQTAKQKVKQPGLFGQILGGISSLGGNLLSGGLI